MSANITFPLRHPGIRDHVLFGAIAAVLGVSIVIMFNPVPPLKFAGAYVDNVNVAPGGTLQVHWQQDWSRACPGDSVRYMRDADGEIKTLAGVAVEPPQSPGYVDRPRPVTVPSKAVKGPAELWAVVTSRCWPWSTFQVTSPKIAFTVQ